MKFTIQTHSEYPDDDYLELPAVDFSKSRKIEGYWQARLIHSASTQENFGSQPYPKRKNILSEIVSTMTKRLLFDEEMLGEEVDYTLHVYMLPQEDDE